MTDESKSETTELSIAYMLEHVRPFNFTGLCNHCVFYTDDELCEKITCKDLDYQNNKKVSVGWAGTSKFGDDFLNTIRTSDDKTTLAVSKQALLSCVKNKNIKSL